MNKNTSCPPIPNSVDQLKNGEYDQVNPESLLPNEIVIMKNGNKISCIQFVRILPENTWLHFYPHMLEPTGDDSEPLLKKIRINNNNVRFYKVNNRKHFDIFAKRMEKTISNYPAQQTQRLLDGEIIVANIGLTDYIGDYLGPPTHGKAPTHGKGGRRKHNVTRKIRKIRKNKRKNTRSIRSKYNR